MPFSNFVLYDYDDQEVFRFLTTWKIHIDYVYRLKCSRKDDQSS